MSDVEITVRGSAREVHPAERATIHAHVAHEGPNAIEVSARVFGQAGNVLLSLKSLHDPSAGPVTSWSARDVRTWTDRPWSQDGEPRPLVHHAHADVEVEFNDFGQLNAWISDMVQVSGFQVDRIEWALTRERRLKLVASARARAVHDARTKAEAYATALDLAGVRPVEIADAGMLGDGRQPNGDESPRFARAMSMDSTGGRSLELVPADIEITAAVDARFVSPKVRTDSLVPS